MLAPTAMWSPYGPVDPPWNDQPPPPPSTKHSIASVTAYPIEIDGVEVIMQQFDGENEPPAYYAPIQAQLERRVEILCRRIRWFFYVVIGCVAGAYLSMMLHVFELTSEDIPAEAFFTLHLGALLFMSIYGIYAAKKQSRKHFQPVFGFALYASVVTPLLRIACHTVSQKSDIFINATHSATLTTPITILSCASLFPVFTVYYACKQAENFKNTGILVFPEGKYPDQTKI